MNNTRYRLQYKQPYAMPNILGNHSFPVHTYRWIDIAACDDLTALKEYAKDLLSDKRYRIQDTQPYNDDTSR